MQFKNFQDGKTLSLANLLSLSNPTLAQSVKNTQFRYISCLEDALLGSQNLIRCEIGSVSYVLALLCKYAGADGEYFAELDEGFLSGECNVGEEEFEELAQWMKDVQNIIIDSSFFAHPDAQMLFEFLEILGKNVVLADGEHAQFHTTGELSELSELANFDGSVVYKISADETRLVGGINFALVSKIKDGDIVSVLGSQELAKSVKFELDQGIKGTVAMLYLKDPSGYAFELVKVTQKS